MSVTLYLASASPRRRELLAQIGVTFDLLNTTVDEAVMPGEAAAAYVVRLARAKALAGWKALAAQDLPRAPVLAADTTVSLGAAIFGKPADRGEALRMLAALSGRTHAVFTAVAVMSAGHIESCSSRSEVTFRHIAPGEAERYWHTGEPLDKAGAYAIQGHGAVFVAELKGSYSGVMGLPLYETAALLEHARMPHWLYDAVLR